MNLGESVWHPTILIPTESPSNFAGIVNAIKLDWLRVMKYFPPGTRRLDHESLSCKRVKLAAASLSTASCTAWKGVGEALTKSRNWWAGEGGALVVVIVWMEADFQLGWASNLFSVLVAGCLAAMVPEVDVEVVPLNTKSRSPPETFDLLLETTLREQDH